MNNIIPLRPRAEVPRGIGSGAQTGPLNQLPVRIYSDITVNRLLRGLHSVALTARYYHTSNCIVIEEFVPEGGCPAHSANSCDDEVTP